MQDLTQEVVRELLHYDPETGIFTWRERDRKWFTTDRSCKTWNSRFAGKKTGCVQEMGRGYLCVRISVLDRLWLAHRLAWLWMEGDPIPEHIDHENHDATDNRWSNIRSSNPMHNSRNASKRVDNTTGTCGLTWNKNDSIWIARVTHNGFRHYLGRFTNKTEAISAINEFRSKLDFDKSHGIKIAPYYR